MLPKDSPHQKWWGFFILKIYPLKFGILIGISYIYFVMRVKEIFEIVDRVGTKIIEHYGISKYQNQTPDIVITDEFSEDEYSNKDKGIVAEYIREENTILIYRKVVSSEEELIRTLIHEFQHYLQSPIWMTRYYTMGYSYENHPYEIQAFKEEESWKRFL